MWKCVAVPPCHSVNTASVNVSHGRSHMEDLKHKIEPDLEKLYLRHSYIQKPLCLTYHKSDFHNN
jgi:hypothetical protein